MWMCAWMYTFVEETDYPLLEEHLRRVILLEKWNIAEFAYDALVTRDHEPDSVNVMYMACGQETDKRFSAGTSRTPHAEKTVYSSRWATRPRA